MAAIGLASPLFLLLALALPQTLLIELIRKIFRQTAAGNLIQISLHKKMRWQSNLFPHHQHRLRAPIRNEFSPMIKIQIRQCINSDWLRSSRKITNYKGY
jgi:hypothetical protein